MFKKASYASLALLSAVQALSANENTNISGTSCKQSPNNYRIDSLTYFDYSSDLPCMYSGNMQSSDTKVDDEYNNFFFWYFPNPDENDLPLIIYMNGGPGATSMTALFEENGPLTCK